MTTQTSQTLAPMPEFVTVPSLGGALGVLRTDAPEGAVSAVVALDAVGYMNATGQAVYQQAG